MPSEKDGEALDNVIFDPRHNRIIYLHRRVQRRKAAHAPASLAQSQDRSLRDSYHPVAGYETLHSRLFSVSAALGSVVEASLGSGTACQNNEAQTGVVVRRKKVVSCLRYTTVQVGRLSLYGSIRVGLVSRLAFKPACKGTIDGVFWMSEGFFVGPREDRCWSIRGLVLN